jgi:hypothetical protein
MLILPPGHAQTLRQPRAFRVREKVMIGGVLAVVVALVAVLVISVGTSEHKSANGCVSVGLAYSTGGQTVYRCGSAARHLCAEVGQPGGINGISAGNVSTECRKAGLPVG